jgi:DNA-binding CsgD family transcriptional regulator
LCPPEFRLVWQRKKGPQHTRVLRVAVATATSIQTTNSTSSHKGTHSPLRDRVLPDKSEVGFLLLDSSLNPVSINSVAIRILGYADGLESARSPAPLLNRIIRARLLSRSASGEFPFVTEFQSGKRHYFCRTFPLGPQVNGPFVPHMAVLLERGPGLAFLSKVAQKFKLTQREQEVLQFLLHGLDGKAIANRMGISPNTVKTFLRLIMTKMGVSSRSAVVVKMITSQW